MVINPKHKVTAAGIKNCRYTMHTMDKRAATPRMAKSRRLHSHRLAVAFRFWG